MPVRFQVTFDCADPEDQAAFWAQALHYQLAPPPEGHASWRDFYRSIGVDEQELEDMGDGVDSIVDPDGAGPRVWFQQVPEGKAIKNRLHFDIKAADRSQPLDERRAKVDTEVERLIALGATVLRVNAEPGMDHYGVTMLDPEGNEFCVA